jgi:hypothetical protein
MAQQEIKTLDDALRLGHALLSEEETKRVLSDILGKEIAAPGAAKDCSALSPGDKCFESRCVNHVKIIMFCDGSMGCTKAIRVNCD